MTCCASARFELTEGSANAGTDARRAARIPSENVRRLSFPTNNDPLVGARTGAPGGAGTSQVLRLAAFSDERQPNLAQTDPKHVHFCTNCGAPSRATVVRSSPLAPAGTHPVAAAGLLAARCRRSGRPGCIRRRPFASRRRRCARRMLRSRRSRAPRCSGSTRSTSSWRRHARTSHRCRRSSQRSAHSATRCARRSTSRAPTRASRNSILARRLQLLYERGRVEPIEVIFGAKSLDEALTNLDNLKNVHEPGQRGPAHGDDGACVVHP